MPVPVSDEQIRAIRTLSGEGFDTKQIATQVGVTPGQVQSVKAHMTMGTYGRGENGPNSADAADDEIPSIGSTAFGLERDLQLALRLSIEQLETGLMVIDGGKEQTVPSGRIDITARDQRGSIVVIELKAGEADRDAVAQTLAYMGDLMTKDVDVPMRGILVAKEFTARAKAAALPVPNVKLVRYGFQFTFESVGKATG
jgi:Endonuclease NucS